MPYRNRTKSGRAFNWGYYALCLLFVAGCAYHPEEYPPSDLNTYYGGGNGLSFEQAVYFPEPKSSKQARPMKDRWLSENYPGYKRLSQGIVMHANKTYDKVKIGTANGEERTIYFDMTPQVSFRGF